MAKAKHAEPKKRTKKLDPETEQLIKKIGDRMKELRKERGYSSYEKFAVLNDIGSAQYNKYERGTEDLRISSLYKVIKAYGISFEDFFKGLE